MFLRHPKNAEDATKAAFLAYLERDLTLDVAKLPHDLLRFAWEASKRQEEFPSTGTPRSRKLEEAVLSLPAEGRAIFILTCVMGFDALDVGTILECPVQKVRDTRTQALRELRRLGSSEIV